MKRTTIEGWYQQPTSKSMGVTYCFCRTGSQACHQVPPNVHPENPRNEINKPQQSVYSLVARLKRSCFWECARNLRNVTRAPSVCLGSSGFLRQGQLVLARALAAEDEVRLSHPFPFWMKTTTNSLVECGGPSLYRMVPGVAGLLLGHTDQKKGSLDILEKQASHDSIFQVLANHHASPATPSKTNGV